MEFGWVAVEIGSVGAGLGPDIGISVGDLKKRFKNIHPPKRSPQHIQQHFALTKARRIHPRKFVRFGQFAILYESHGRRTLTSKFSRRNTFQNRTPTIQTIPFVAHEPRL
jgi:hypothetical protein